MSDFERRRDAILLVDDEPATRRVFARFLTSAGYRVIEAADGVGAIEEMALSGRIGLLIADVRMPGMDGPEMVATVRRHQPDLPVLFVSGYAPPERMPAGVRFLAKPFESAELLKVVGELHLTLPATVSPAADSP
jgi:CheY-like chemotaxis protein